ncbi:MAG: AAA family ATPase [Clostridia bacterium]
MDDRERSLEQKRLGEAIRIIDKYIENLKGQLQNGMNRIRGSNKDMWEETKKVLHDFNDVVSSLVYLDSIKNEYFRYESISRQLKKLELLRKSAYFGRIDFREEHFKAPEEIYIGTSTLNDDKGDILIYDWRAAICSMFYECEIGPASFMSPDGTIKGEITLKRQYRISHDVIKTMFDATVVIEDEVLQEILSRSKDTRMNTIVASIQKEQNKAIRDENHTIVMVKGPAGSGKTSIALHRVAWLLYRHRERMLPRDIVIFSPNEIFNDYISEVLPQLGEENMVMSTFIRLSKEFLGGRHRLSSRAGQMETILTAQNDTLAHHIRFKTTEAFIDGLEAYVKGLETGGIRFKDVCCGNDCLVTKQEIHDMYYKDFKGNIPAVRFQKIKTLLDRKLVSHVKVLRRKSLELSNEDYNLSVQRNAMIRASFAKMRGLIEENTSPDFPRIYHQFLLRTKDNGIISRHKTSMKADALYYEDIAPVLFIKLLMGYKYHERKPKHIVIDEVQDYSPIELKVLFSIFKDVPMTLLGDDNQSIYHYTDLPVLKKNMIPQAFDVTLDKSYRSTRQIAAFCGRIIGDGLRTGYINREGNAPVVKESGDMGKDVLSHIDALREKGCASIAIITRTHRTATLLLEKLSTHGVRGIKPDDEEFIQGTVVLASYMAKGLEFDGVILVSPESDRFRGEEERKLFYTCCSRALHELAILYEGEIPEYIQP